MGSKIKVNFGTLCIKPYGHDTDCSFSPITFKLHMQVVEDEYRNPIDFWLRGQRSRSTWAFCLLQATCLPDHFQTSLVYFTCKLLLMSGGTLSILGHGVKDQGQLRHSVYKTLLA